MSKPQALLLAASTLVVGLVVGASNPLERSFERSNPVASPQSAPALADFIIDFGDGELALAPDQSFTPGESAFDLTKKITAEKKLLLVFDPPGEGGVFVKEIAGRKNGQNNKYWQYWVNAEQVQVAADKYQLQPNDVVEWKFIKSQPEQ